MKNAAMKNAAIRNEKNPQQNAAPPEARRHEACWRSCDAIEQLVVCPRRVVGIRARHHAAERPRRERIRIDFLAAGIVGYAHHANIAQFQMPRALRWHAHTRRDRPASKNSRAACTRRSWGTPQCVGIVMQISLRQRHNSKQARSDLTRALTCTQTGDGGAVHRRH
jgi:hypothetical protein